MFFIRGAVFRRRHPNPEFFAGKLSDPVYWRYRSFGAGDDVAEQLAIDAKNGIPVMEKLPPQRIWITGTGWSMAAYAVAAPITYGIGLML